MSRNAHPVRRTGGWLTLGLLAALGAPAARAAGPDSPVEALREALLETRAVRAGRGVPPAVRERIEKLAGAVVRPGDLRRALLLDEWGPGDFPQARFAGPSDTFDAVRKGLAARLERTLDSTLKAGTPPAQLAALTLLADLEAEESQPRPGRFPGGVNARPPHFAPRLVPAVRGLLDRTKNPDVRAAAGLTLSRIGTDPKDVVPALERLLAEGQGLVERRAGAKGLARFLRDDQMLPPQALGQRGQAVLPAAGNALADGDSEVRRHCLAAIREGCRILSEQTFRLDGPPEFQAIQKPPPGAPRGQEEEYRKVIERQWQVLLVVARPLNEQTPAVTKALRDDDPDVRLAAYQALEAVATARHGLKRMAAAAPPDGKPFKDPLDNAPKAVQPLTGGLTHDNVRIRLAALYVLETLGPDAAPATDALARALEKDKNKNPFVRWGAARALAAMAPLGGEAAVGALAKGLADENKDVRYTAALALQRHGPAAKTAVKALAQAVERKDDGRLRQLAAQALAAVGPGAKEGALPALVSALSAPEAPARAAAATALAAVGGATGREGVEALRNALNDPDAAVREAASSALLNEAAPAREAPQKKPE